jgi:hypothetical protein
LKFSHDQSTVGQTDTMHFMPSDFSSSTIALGSGQHSGSNVQSPIFAQWWKSMTMTDTGSLRRWYSRATSSSSFCVL